MNKSTNIKYFQTLSIPEKLDFLSDGFIESITELNENSLNSLLRSIILDVIENSYVRKYTLKLFTDLVIVGKIKTRHAYSLLIDDWIPGSNISLEVQRLKDLLLYYETSNGEDRDIESVFTVSAEDSEAEIVAESLYNLGIVSLMNAFVTKNNDDYKIYLDNGSRFFTRSTETIENRVDSIFFQKVIMILEELLLNKWDSARIYINELAVNLFQKEVFSFNHSFDSLQFGFYKIVISLQQICIKKPKDWIDYRLEIDKLYLNYTEVTNSKIRVRLSEKSLLKKIGRHFKNFILEPFFVLNLSSEVVKIDVLMRDCSNSSHERDFLQYLKDVIQGSDKKKIELEHIKNEFRKLFPNHNPQTVAELIDKLHDPIDYLRAFELLSQKDNVALIEHLMFACSKLQGDKKYWGKSVNENDRNKYLATLLEAAGYTIKDQTQWSTSYEGKESGEIDIFVTEPNGMPQSIIEALILDSLKQDYLILHLNKLFKYDTTGLENNFIITYSFAKSFDSFWSRYKDFISKHVYEYDFIDFKELDKYNYADIKIGVAQHLRNGKKINLYHLMVNLVER